MSGVTLCVIGLVALFVLLFAGMNVAFSMMIVGFFGYSAMTTLSGGLSVVSTVAINTASNYTYTVIGLFVLMGFICFEAGLSSKLFTFANKWLNWLPGGLACAYVLACGLFGAICGSVTATTSTMTTVSMPEMRRYKYDDQFSCGVAATASVLGTMIPPSSGLIIYGILTQTSIGKLFAACIIPGIVVMICFFIAVIIQVKIKPSIAPQVETHVSWGERLKSLVDVFPIIALFILVIGGMFGGLFSTTEAAAVGCVGAIVLMLINKNFNLVSIKRCLLNTVKTMGMIYLILTGAQVLNSFLVLGGLPVAVANMALNGNVNLFTVLLSLSIIYIVLGCLMDTMPIIILVIPIFLPVLLKLGADIIWVGIITQMLALIGYITPPVGLGCYIVSGVVKDVPLQKIFKGAMPMLAALAVATIIVMAIPQLSLWIPSLI